jgi:hypothetical protein
MPLVVIRKVRRGTELQEVIIWRRYKYDIGEQRVINIFVDRRVNIECRSV